MKNHASLTLTTVFALLAATDVALAQNETCGRLPPMRFLHEPAAPYTVQTLGWDEIQRVCTANNAFGAPPAWGCVVLASNEIYIFEDLSKLEQECVLRHEKAHINGWPAHHPIR